MQESSATRGICAGCRHFQTIDNTTGTCHRFPTAFAGNHSPREDHHWRFPMVSNHSWCGEFRANDNGR